MKEYEVIVIGSGAGAAIVEQALSHKMKTAWVDKGPLGGTCLNVGCIPSKMLITAADRVMDIRTAAELGVRAEIKAVDFKAIMKRTNDTVRKSRDQIRKGISNTAGLDFYGIRAEFVDDSTLRVGPEIIRGKKIFIVCGARPAIPPVKGIESLDYLTNENVLDLGRAPESLAIVGGGYIAVEFAHFFAAMGSRVIVLQRAERLVRDEEPEVSALLALEMKKRMEVHTGVEVLEAEKTGAGVRIVASVTKSGSKMELDAEKIFVAAGRRSNADLLAVDKSGVQMNDDGYIRVDKYFRTSRPNIWAFGDAIGKKMFRHAANEEAEYVWHNSVHDDRREFDFNTVPHAVFSWPQIAAVGLGEREAAQTHDILVGIAPYSSIAKGEAMRETLSFAKAIVEKNSWKLLGFHIIGPQASILIQEVVNAMSSEGTVMPVVRTMHIHPALSELIQAALGSLRQPS